MTDTLSVGTYYNNEPNNIEVNIGSLRLYFSYKTVVAFDDAGDFACRQNDWSTTTGKHLNHLCPNKKERLASEVFESKLAAVLKKHNLAV